MKKIWSVVILLCLSTAMFSQDVVLFYESFDQCIGYGTPGSDDYEDMGYTGDAPEEYDPTTKISYQQSAVSIQKIIRNGQLFIIRDNAIYTITGQIAE